MINPASKFLRCTQDRFTQVRNERGELLGCVPRINDTVQGIRGLDGIPYEVRIGAVAMLVVPNDYKPQLDNFTPLDMFENADLAEPPTTDQV